MTTKTKLVDPQWASTIEIEDSGDYPGHVLMETEAPDNDGLIRVSADALREAIDKAVPPTPKPFDITAQLAESWERAEVGVPKEGDLLIGNDDYDSTSYSIWNAGADYQSIHEEIRIVKRAPKPEAQLYVNGDSLYIRIGETRFLSAQGHADAQEAQLIADGYVPAKVSAA